jgi:hypothetical protein
MNYSSYYDAKFALDDLIRTGTATIDKLSNLIIDTAENQFSNR